MPAVPGLRAPSPVRTVLVAALLSGALALVPTAAPAGALGPSGALAAAPGETPTRTITYEVRARGSVQADLAQLSRVAVRTFNDRRGWSLGGSLRFREVASGGEFTLWLAAPGSMESFSSLCSAQYSCQVGRHVVINDARWRTGTSTWPDVREYRPYVLNHELGHWLGLGHTGCSNAGAPAPVMMRQSKGLGGCRSNTWPLDQERRAAAARARVAVQPEAPALYAVERDGPSATQVHVVDGDEGYSTRPRVMPSLLGPTAGQDWAFAVSDHDRDGVDDLYAIAQRGGSGRTEVHVLDGASGYRRWLLHAVTALHATTAADWTFAVGDADGDGVDDVYAVNRHGATGTEVHVLDGASGFRAWSLHAATPLHRTARDAWSFAVGDHDRDGVDDLHAVARSGASGRTELHVLDGASGFGAWSLHAATPLAPTRRDDWSFAAEDVDGDGYDDLVALARGGASGRTEVHALADGGRRWVLHAATALAPTRGESRWSLDLE